MHFLLAPPCHGVVGVSIHLLQELTHVGLTCMADQWARSPLAVRVVPVAGGDKLFMILGMTCTILGVVYERSLLCPFGSINSRVPGIDFLILLFRSLL
jgi:hypothetical protein